MKTFKIILAVLLLALTVTNVAIEVSALSPETGVVLSIKDQKSLDSVQEKAKTWYANRIKSVGMIKAYANLESVIGKLGVLQMKHKKNPRNYAILFKLRTYCEELLNPTLVNIPVIVPPVTTVPVTASETKQLTQTEAKKVDTVTALIDSQKDPSREVVSTTKNSLQSLGISVNDSRLLTLKSEQGDGFTFCANFTSDLYPVEAEYRDAQSANSKLFDKLVLRIQYAGNVWLDSENPDLFNKRKTMYTRAMRCANVMHGYGQTFGFPITQTYVSNLFNKLGQTYTIQSKPFYEMGIDAKDLETWINAFGNGKIK